MDGLLAALLEGFLEGLLELAVALVGEALKSRRPGLRATTAAFLFAGAGAALGGLSLLFWSKPLFHAPGAQVVNLVVTPLLVGWAMGARGYLTAERAFRWASALNGLLLAALFAWVRFAALT